MALDITKQSHEVMANMLQAQPTKTNNDGNARFTAFEARIVALENSRSPASNKTREATHEQEQRSTRAVATGFIANSREEETMIFLRLVVREVGIERETEAITRPSKPVTHAFSTVRHNA